MQMSVEELTAYMGQVSSLVITETSTIDGLGTVKLSYDTLINQTESTLQGLNTEILVNGNVIQNFKLQEISLGNQLSTLDSQISTQLLLIQEQDGIILSTSRQISDLTLEDITLSTQIFQSESTFTGQATFYSSLYQLYMNADAVYTGHLATLSTTESQYNSTVAAEAVLLPIYNRAKSTFDGTNFEISTFQGIGVRLAGELTVAQQVEFAAQNALTSTKNALTTISSLYETAVINKQYVDALSTQAIRITEYASAIETQTLAQADVRTNPTPATSNALTLANQMVTTTNAAKTQVDTQVAALRSTLSLASDNSYQTLLSSINADIATEVNNISTFQSQKKIAYDNMMRFSTQMETALSDVMGYVAQSTFFTTAYLSSLAGVTTLNSQITTQQAQLATDDATIATLSTSIQGFTKNIQDLNSTYNSFISLSSLYKQQYDSTFQAFTLYSTAFLSTNTAIGALEQEQITVDSTILGLESVIRLQSTIERREDIRIRTSEREVSRAFGGLRRGKTEYHETFLRIKRLSTQVEYENLVVQQLQIASTLFTTTGSSISSVVNLNTPDIQAKYNQFVSINGFLANFDTYYQTQQDQDTLMTTYATRMDELLQAQIAVDNASDALALNPTNTVLQDAFTRVTSTLTGMAALTANMESQITARQVSLDTMESAIVSYYQSTFTIFEQTRYDNMVSSVLSTAIGGP